MTTTATAPVQEALFGRFGEVQTDLLDAIADAEREAAMMHRYGFEAGQADRLDGDYSAPIEAEDGPDYTAGYLAGWNA